MYKLTRALWLTRAKNADVALDFMEYWLTRVLFVEMSQMPLNTGVVSDNLMPMVKTLAEMRVPVT